MGCCKSSSNESEMEQVVTAGTPQSTNGHTAAEPQEQSPQKSKSKPNSPVIKSIGSTRLTHEKTKSNSHSDYSLDLDGDEIDERKANRDEMIAKKKTEIEEEAKRLADLQNEALDVQVTRQRGKSFMGLYEVFSANTMNSSSDKMDIDGLTEALKHFGLIIDTNRALQKEIFKKFDIDNVGEIDYNDFSATLSSLIGTKDEENCFFVFQIFDNDQDGYLSLNDMARILLAQNQIARVVTGQNSNENIQIFTKKQCLKKAQKMIDEYDADDGQFKDGQIDPNEFMKMMMTQTTKSMMIANMKQVSVSDLGVGQLQKKQSAFAMDIHLSAEMIDDSDNDQ